MAQKIRDLMTTNVVALDSATPVMEAAKKMAERDIGDVVVLENEEMCGIVTDRDITVRVVAEGKNPTSTSLKEICSQDLITLDPESSVGDAVRLMSEKAVRRLPIIENGKPVGIVSIGDLAMRHDPDSALADISEAPANN